MWLWGRVSTRCVSVGWGCKKVPRPRRAARIWICRWQCRVVRWEGWYNGDKWRWLLRGRDCRCFSSDCGIRILYIEWKVIEHIRVIGIKTSL